MEITKQFAVIIPVHELTSETGNLLIAALDSVASQKVAPAAVLIVAATQEIADLIGDPKAEVLNAVKENPVGLLVVTREEGANTNFQAQVNAGVAALSDKITHFTVLEFDDVLRPTYTKHAATYLGAFPEASVLLPLVEEVNTEGALLKYSNEVIWTPNFSENLGELDYEALTGFANFHLTGAVINKADFVEAGGLKESMELTFNYEFLLRLTQKGKTVRSIPKAIYIHLDSREGSLFKTYTEGRNALTDEEVRFWFDTAHKECFFPEDRKVAYSPVKGE